MHFEPLVSIIIPVYNGSNFLSQAIDSALKQSYPNIEIIVINDGSNDEGKTEKISIDYGNKIRYFFKKNGGVASALNLGIKKMRGDFFSWLSHDDLYFENKIEEQINFLSTLKDREKKVIFCNYSVYDKNLKKIRDIQLSSVLESEIETALLRNCFINGCTVLVPKTCFQIAGVFNETLKTTQDYDFWLRLCRYYEFRFLNKVLVIHRIHKMQDSQTKKTLHLNEIDCTKLLHIQFYLKKDENVNLDLLLKMYLIAILQNLKKTRIYLLKKIGNDFRKIPLDKKIKFIYLSLNFVIKKGINYLTQKFFFQIKIISLKIFTLTNPSSRSKLPLIHNQNSFE